MSSSALQWFGEARRRYARAARRRSLPFSIVTRLIEQPRGRYSEAPLPTLNVHLSWPAIRVPDTPPDIGIDIPLAPVPVVPQLARAIP